jgi:hypothetical protein
VRFHPRLLELAAHYHFAAHPCRPARQKRQETDAAELMREHRETKAVKQTAWNNRLSALANMGLVVELSEGRAKRYRSLLAGATYGS